MSRVTEKLVDCEWVPSEFSSLMDGDMFRVIDDGKLYVDENENSVFTVVGEPYLDDNGHWRVEIL